MREEIIHKFMQGLTVEDVSERTGHSLERVSEVWEEYIKLTEYDFMVMDGHAK